MELIENVMYGGKGSSREAQKSVCDTLRYTWGVKFLKCFGINLPPTKYNEIN